MKLQKSRVTPIDLKKFHEIYTSLKQTYPDNSNRKIENLDDLGCPRVENLFF